MKLKITRLASLSELADEGLREEGSAWAEDEGEVVAGRALQVPDDGSGPMEGFFRSKAGMGMVEWGSLSDWIEADSLEDMFRKYTEDL